MADNEAIEASQHVLDLLGMLNAQEAEDEWTDLEWDSLMDASKECYACGCDDCHDHYTTIMAKAAEMAWTGAPRSL